MRVVRTRMQKSYGTVIPFLQILKVWNFDCVNQGRLKAFSYVKTWVWTSRPFKTTCTLWTSCTVKLLIEHPFVDFSSESLFWSAELPSGTLMSIFSLLGTEKQDFKRRDRSKLIPSFCFSELSWIFSRIIRNVFQIENSRFSL